MVEGPQAGLALIDALAGDLDGYHLLHAARADLLRRIGSSAEAAKSYGRALALVTNESERRFLDVGCMKFGRPEAVCRCVTRIPPESVIRIKIVMNAKERTWKIPIVLLSIAENMMRRDNYF